MRTFAVVCLVTGVLGGTAQAHPGASRRRAPKPDFPWLDGKKPSRTLADAFSPPRGYTRVQLADDSFGAWLRRLPLRPDGTPVDAYDGRRILDGDDERLAAVVDLDVSKYDRQQCADSIMRLHAEWRWATGDASRVTFNATSGDAIPWRKFTKGQRPRFKGNKQTWVSGKKASSHKDFRAYLEVVFAYASTRSLAKEAATVTRKELKPGDFFVLPGGPGHAVLILDIAEDAKGHRRALLGQGFMPAQDFHVLAHDGEPWFSLDGEDVETPFWSVAFPWSSLRRL